MWAFAPSFARKQKGLGESIGFIGFDKFDWEDEREHLNVWKVERSCSSRQCPRLETGTLDPPIHLGTEWVME